MIEQTFDFESGKLRRSFNPICILSFKITSRKNEWKKLCNFISSFIDKGLFMVGVIMSHLICHDRAKSLSKKYKGYEYF